MTQADTASQRTSDHEMTHTRRFNAPARLVYAAFTQPAIVTRWWAPRSLGMEFVSCEIDLRVGGEVRFVFRHPAFPAPMAFFGHYLEVVPDTRLVWTNEEGGPDGPVTTVTFTDEGAATRVVMHERYASKAALDAAIAEGSVSGFDESFAQLDAVLPALA